MSHNKLHTKGPRSIRRHTNAFAANDFAARRSLQRMRNPVSGGPFARSCFILLLGFWPLTSQPTTTYHHLPPPTTTTHHHLLPPPTTTYYPHLLPPPTKYDRKVMAPPWGLSTPRAPKELFNYFLKSDLVTKQVFFLRISTIFCMRKTVIISNGSRILPCPLGLKNDLKTTIYFLTFFQNYFFILFESPYFCFLLVPPWGHLRTTQ